MTQIWTDDIIVPVTEVFVPEAGEELTALEAGTKVIVTGKSKGRGFQGVVKRYGFHGGPKSHGTKHTHRTPGSIGATDPQRVMPGKKMPGRMGNARVTVKNVRVAQVDAEKKSVLLRGAVPGPREGSVEIVTNDTNA